MSHQETAFDCKIPMKPIAIKQLHMDAHGGGSVSEVTIAEKVLTAVEALHQTHVMFRWTWGVFVALLRLALQAKQKTKNKKC